MKRLLIILGIVVAGCHGNVKKEKENVQPAQNIASIKLTDLDGRELNLDQYKGKTVFLNFWAA